VTVTRINPPGLTPQPAYHHVAVGTGSRLITVAGQVARDADGALVGEGDLAAQVAQSYRNVVTALAGADATVADLMSTTVYVVDWTPDKMDALMTGLITATSELGHDPGPLPPATLIGVSALADPELLCEIQVFAVAD
jgi:enamine deaminase RidA (YjgF/YER057c/UK114 family)